MGNHDPIAKSIVEEFIKVALIAKPLLPTKIDGKSAILEMKNGASRNWRQMEWIGFWFEYFIETEVKPKLGNTIGPRYGNTVFDLQLENVWDLKAHPNHSSQLLLNDQDAVRKCIIENGGVGFIIIEGAVEYDDVNESFKNWHDKMKGKQSDYVTARIHRNAPSRRRKISFQPTSIVGVWIDSLEVLIKGQADGWISGFQENMRNADGKPRRSKFKFNTLKIPEANIAGRIQIQ
jgi:hypothetical protein